MMALISTLVLGFVLGMRHATDADHVVAVTTILSRERSVGRAALIGMIWGIGHTLTIALVGGAILVFGWVVPATLGLSLEFVVALMLIGLGAWSLREACGAHEHHENPDALARGQTIFRPFAVGSIHGLAGSAAVALLVLPVIQNHLWAVGYLLVFGAGTIAGMMLITAALALPFTWTAAVARRFNRGLVRTAALASVGFGGFLVYDIGFVQGLLLR